MPDEKKGERLVVLHTLPEDKLAPVLQSFATCELPALWKPRANQFIRVVALPMLGTGKIDLRGVKSKPPNSSSQLDCPGVVLDRHNTLCDA